MFSNVDERGDYPAEDKAVIDMETLVHLLTKWVVDVYNVSVNRGIGARPLDRWLESADRRIIELPVYPQQLEVLERWQLRAHRLRGEDSGGRCFGGY